MIKSFFSLLFTALIFTTAVTAQSKNEQQVAIAVEALRKAMVDADKTMLEKLTHDSLSYGHSSGKVESKAAFLENVTNGNSGFESIELTGQTIFVTGKTAIVRHRFVAVTDDKGKPKGAANIGVLTVWQKDKKQWKMLARQAVKLL
ncbi:MAG: nuclear transport factor 2 family protein [Aquabacterium sp.]|nr:nuclear transport factor 2 family protein [Ferruginibacter sp.]